MSLDRPLLSPVSPDLIWFTGPDTIRFLNDLISQEIGSLTPGDAARSFLLTPQGKLDHIFWVLRGVEEAGLVTEPGRGEDLMAKLARYRIRVKVEIEPSGRESWLVVGPFGVEPGHWTGEHASLVADVSWPTLRRALVVGERPDLPPIDLDAYETLRIEAGEPLMGVDIGDATIPQETGLVTSSISFDKGCFLGQELVARLDSRGGRVNHHLRILRFQNAAPEVGGEVTRGGEGVGMLTSAAGSVGLALLRRGVEPGDVVEVAGVGAVVESVPEE